MDRVFVSHLRGIMEYLLAFVLSTFHPAKVVYAAIEIGTIVH